MDLLQVTNRHQTQWTTNCHSNDCHLFTGFRNTSANQRATRPICFMDPWFIWRLGSCHSTWLCHLLLAFETSQRIKEPHACKLLYRHVISVTSSLSGLTLTLAWEWGNQCFLKQKSINNICNVSGVWAEQPVFSIFIFIAKNIQVCS